MPLSLGGAAFTCNSAQCAGWTSAEVLRARWGGDFAAYYSRLAALADEISGAVLCWDVRLPRPVTTAAAPGRPRQAKTCG